MVVFTVKAKKKKVAIVLFVTVMLIVGLFGIKEVSGYIKEKEKRENDFAGETLEQQAAFLEGFGWEVDETMVKSETIQIPGTFDETFEAYNQLQLEIGLDLSSYKSSQVEKISFPLKNAPELGEGVCARLLILNGKIIGADICSLQNGGFVRSIADTTVQTLEPVFFEEDQSSEVVGTVLPAENDGAWPID